MRSKLKWLLLAAAVLAVVALFVRWKTRVDAPPRATLETFAADLRSRRRSLDAFVFDGQHASDEALLGQNWERTIRELERQGGEAEVSDQSSVIIRFPDLAYSPTRGAKLIPTITLSRNRPQAADAPDVLKVTRAEFALRSPEHLQADEWFGSFPSTSSMGMILIRPKFRALVGNHPWIRDLSIRHSHTREIPNQRGYLNVQFSLGSPPEKEEQTLNLSFQFTTDLEPHPQRYVSWIPLTYLTSRDATTFLHASGEMGENPSTRQVYVLRKKGVEALVVSEPPLSSVVTNKGLERASPETSTLDVSQVPSLDFKLLRRFAKVKVLDVGIIGSPSQARELASLLALQDLRFRTDSPKVLAEIGRVRTLTSVRLVGLARPGNSHLLPESLIPLASLPKLRQLTVTRTNTGGDAVIRILAASSELRDLIIIEPGTYTAQGLINLTRIEHLRKLWIRGDSLRAAEWSALARCSSIEELLISGGTLDKSSLHRILSMPKLKRLRFSRVSGQMPAEAFKYAVALQDLSFLSCPNLKLEDVKRIQEALGENFAFVD